MPLDTALVLTISDSASAGKREDLSGPEARRILTEAGFEVQSVEILPDDRSAIETRLRSASAEGFQLVVTTGGTGFSPRDVTPEATLAVVEKIVPGIPELMRFEGAFWPKTAAGTIVGKPAIAAKDIVPFRKSRRFGNCAAEEATSGVSPISILQPKVWPISARNNITPRERRSSQSYRKNLPTILFDSTTIL